MVVEDGQELGISIRGGAEHGLGIYVSVVEEDSVADNYGLKASIIIISMHDYSGALFIMLLLCVHAQSVNNDGYNYFHTLKSNYGWLVSRGHNATKTLSIPKTRGFIL